MVDSELDTKVRKVVEDTYGCETTFRIKSKVVGNTYVTQFYLHNYDIDPLQIMWEGDSEEDFLKYLSKELKQRNLLRSRFYKIRLAHDIEI